MTGENYSNFLAGAIDMVKDGLFIEKEYGVGDPNLENPTSNTLYYDKAEGKLQKAILVNGSYYDYSIPEDGKYIKYMVPFFNLNSVFFTKDSNDSSLYHMDMDMLKKNNVLLDSRSFSSYNYDLPFDKLDISLANNEVKFVFTSPSIANAQFNLTYSNIGNASLGVSKENIKHSADDLTWDNLFVNTNYNDAYNKVIEQVGGKKNMDLIPTLGDIYPDASVSKGKTLYGISYVQESEDEFIRVIGDNYSEENRKKGIYETKLNKIGFTELGLDTKDPNANYKDYLFNFVYENTVTNENNEEGKLYIYVAIETGATATSNKGIGIYPTFIKNSK